MERTATPEETKLTHTFCTEGNGKTQHSSKEDNTTRTLNSAESTMSTIKNIKDRPKAGK